MTRFEQVGRDLRERLAARVLVLDGALGTMIQRAGLSADDFGGAAYDGCNEHLVRTRPDVVRAIHEAYLQAGADIIETDTFGGTPLALAEYGLERDAAALNVEAARLARTAADRWSTASWPRFVAGAIGPTNRSLSVTGGATFAELTDAFYVQARALVDGGVDILLLETFHDTRNAKAALLAVERLRADVGAIPVMVSATLEASGTMLAGQSIEAFCASISHADLLSIGINCSTGPEQLQGDICALSAASPVHASCHPNAGLPDAEGAYAGTPESFAARLAQFAGRGWLNIVGGCCGTTEAHIGAASRALFDARPRALPRGKRRSWYSGIDLVDLDRGPKPLLVGERANVVGSRAFNRLIAARQWDEAADVARDQVRHGAAIVDVCLQSADREEREDIPPFYERLIRSVRAPIMIDTTDVEGMELALSYCQGRSLVNSANLEDGGARLARICQVVKRHGAALVLGCIDDHPDQPQAFTRERKLDVAARAFRTATSEHGLTPEDVVIDPLVFPCASGDPAYIGSARETADAIPLIKAALPGVRTVLGISNVSFGLPAPARRVVDSVFLHHCTQAGLDLAIVNAASVLPYESIPPVERELADNLLFNLPVAAAEDPLARQAPADVRAQSPEEKAAIARHHIVAITDHFRSANKSAAAPIATLSLDERIARHVVEGSRHGLIADLEAKRADGTAPLDIVNGPLMAGMAEVARLFRDNKVIVAEVLRSAEVMRAAVRHLEQFLTAAETTTRGSVLLATVKGDVHDIGKDLVKVILANNGYSVIDLGTRVTPEALVAACQQHQPTAIGLSGLLVKSAYQMVETAAALERDGIRVPLLVGGAALSPQFTLTKIAPAYGGIVRYASDAMAGLALMGEIVSGSEPPAATAAAATAPAPAQAESVLPFAPRARVPQPRVRVPIPRVPYTERRAIRPDVREVWDYLNPFMLYNRHLGFRGDLAKRLDVNDTRAADLVRIVDDVKHEAEGFMGVRALWRFFEAERDGEVLHLFVSGADSPAHSFRFDRQRAGGGACLTDYVLDPAEGRRDQVVLFVASAGAGIRDRAAEWNEAGEFLQAHALQALALETAEACAEWLHRRVRADWGFPDPPTTTVRDLFTSRYRGKRYSFGYPACPNLEDQRGIFKLLQPADIDVSLTDGMMMDPEASVSGIVFHHPDCEYFAVESRSERENRR